MIPTSDALFFEPELTFLIAPAAQLVKKNMFHQVAFNRTVLPIPNINLRSNSLHQPRVPRRVAASVLPGTPLLGDFGHLDYVRDPEGRRGRLDI